MEGVFNKESSSLFTQHTKPIKVSSKLNFEDGVIYEEGKDFDLDVDENNLFFAVPIGEATHKTRKIKNVSHNLYWTTIMKHYIPQVKVAQVEGEDGRNYLLVQPQVFELKDDDSHPKPLTQLTESLLKDATEYFSEKMAELKSE